MRKENAFHILILALAIAAITSCKTYKLRSNYRDLNELIHNTSNLQNKLFLKAHHINGDVSILTDTWKVDTTLNTVSGKGERFDFNRYKKYEGEITIPADSVLIFETNQESTGKESGRIALLTILAGADFVMTMFCLANPKACFGSCPTFYINENDNFHYSNAEGFTRAIRPSLEYWDIDALGNEQVKGGAFSVTMKNEALKTHCVNEVKLLAYPRKDGERAYHSPDNNFYLCEGNYPVTRARAKEGDVTMLVRDNDLHERYSMADEKNISSKEEIFLDFENVSNKNDLALIINYRQTLMTTYLIYSALGYMGNEVSDIFARMERNKEIDNKVKNGILKELGIIEVYQWNEQTTEWEYQKGFDEVGPIAINRQCIPLRNLPGSTKIRIKLVLNQGLWRIDQAALTNIKKMVHPVEIKPDEILKKGKPDKEALIDILDPAKYLISLPGSEYKIHFTLPDENSDYELFIYSKGYYIEWMRAQWLQEKNLVKLWKTVNAPKTYLRQEAGNYKKYETKMENIFWNSKIDTKNSSYNEK